MNITPENDLPLVSTELTKVAENAEKSDKPVLRLWVAQNVDTQALKDGTFDEADVLKTAQTMLADTGRFLSEPEIVQEFRKTIEAVTARQDEYLRTAMLAQKERVKKLLGSADLADAEKRPNDFRRYVAKAEAELATLHGSKEAERIARTTDERVSKLKGAPLLGNFITVLDIKDVRKVQKEVIDEANKRFQKAKEKVQNLKRELDIAEKRAAIKQKLQGVLAATDERLAAMGALDAPSSVPTLARPVMKSASESQSTVQIKPQNGRKGTESHLKLVPPVPVDAEINEKKDKLSAPESQRNSDVVKLREVVSAAEAGSNKIRVLVPKGKSANFEAGWMNVFAALGFEGKVEMIELAGLQNTADLESPVVLVKNMNGLTKKWGNRAFSKVVITELSSTNHLTTMIEKDNALQQPQMAMDEQKMA